MPPYARVSELLIIGEVVGDIDSALKAVVMRRGTDAWGHTVTALRGVVAGTTMHRRSRLPRVVKPNNETVVEQAVRRWAAEIAAQQAEVRRIVRFGLCVSGIPFPASDVHVCPVLASSDKPFRERAAD